jgi:nucleotide-binding universal stress UspA family protein
MFKHILVPTDGSRLSLESARAAVQLARSLGARVTAFFAAPPATPIVYKAFLPLGYAAPEEHRKRIEKAARSYLAAVEKAAEAADVPCETAVATSDFPADVILAAARKGRWISSSWPRTASAACAGRRSSAAKRRRCWRAHRFRFWYTASLDSLRRPHTRGVFFGSRILFRRCSGSSPHSAL